ALSDSSSSVSRSNSNVPSPCAFSPSATAMLRGLNRLEPLPCANATKAAAFSGIRSVPANPMGGMRTSRISSSICGLLAGAARFLIGALMSNTLRLLSDYLQVACIFNFFVHRYIFDGLIFFDRIRLLHIRRLVVQQLRRLVEALVVAILSAFP